MRKSEKLFQDSKKGNITDYFYVLDEEEHSAEWWVDFEEKIKPILKRSTEEQMQEYLDTGVADKISMLFEWAHYMIENGLEE